MLLVSAGGGANLNFKRNFDSQQIPTQKRLILIMQLCEITRNKKCNCLSIIRLLCKKNVFIQNEEYFFGKKMRNILTSKRLLPITFREITLTKKTTKWVHTKRCHANFDFF